MGAGAGATSVQVIWPPEGLAPQSSSDKASRRHCVARRHDMDSGGTCYTRGTWGEASVPAERTGETEPMLERVYRRATVGLDDQLIEVGYGIPSMFIVGLPDSASEAS